MIATDSTTAGVRVLGTRMEPASARNAAWHRLLAESDWQQECITPEEAASHPTLACRLRAVILNRTYSNDYHTDSVDIDRLARAVRQHRERILFWGDPGAIAVARDWFTRGESPGEATLQSLNFGTASTLDAGDAYGEGYAELSRTGSVCADVPASAPILAEVTQLLCGGAPNFRSRHTFVAVPRNRRSSTTIRGGSAIHRLHVRVIRSSFWGVAPWYVMQGGFIEMLDYRELYRDPEAIAALHSHIRELWFDCPDSAAYALSFIALNFGRDACSTLTVSIAPPHGSATTGWKVSYLGPPNLRRFCPAIIRPADSDATTFDALLDEALSAAAVAVYVPLEEPGPAAVQHSLRQRGFQLTAVIPSKPAGEERTPFTGVWSKTKPGIPWAEPYYLHMPAEGCEGAILNHLRSLCKGKTS